MQKPESNRDSLGRFLKGTHWRPHAPFREREYLVREYVKKNRSAAEIGADYGVGGTAIIYWLVKFGIPRRNTTATRAVKYWGSVGSTNPMYGKKGAANPRYVDGSSPARQRAYAQSEGRAFIRSVLARDGFGCGVLTHNSNPMPESVTDRCTKAHEYIFLLSKCERYFFDSDAIKEHASMNTHARISKYKTPDGWDTSKGSGGHGSFHKNGREAGHVGYQHKRKAGVTPKSAPPSSGIKANDSFQAATSGQVVDRRNKRSVWTVPTRPYSDAHFATFPPELIEPCILAGSRTGDIVLDPFFGSGTTGEVAERLGRQWIGIEINDQYVKLAKRRTNQRGLPL